MKKAILHGTGMIKRFEETEVLHGIDIDVFEGDFTVIMGSSGSGKSTLLYALSGMDSIGLFFSSVTLYISGNAYVKEMERRYLP